MNRTIKRNFMTIVFLVTATSVTSLMAQSEKQMERFNMEREAYFNEKLALTESEKTAFWPVYNDFHNRKMKIVEEERNAFRYAHKNSENLSDEEIKKILGKIRILKQEHFKLETEYYQNKFPSVLSSKKVLKLYKVEWDFRRHLVGKLRGQGPGDRRNNEGRPGRGSDIDQDSQDPPSFPLL